MSGLALTTLKAAAATFQGDEIHVWRVAYKPALGRLPLLSVLAAYLGCAESMITLESEEHGRPRLAAEFGKNIDFNWSHSGDVALIAIGRHVRPGVDVEQVRPRPGLLEIARRYFEQGEFSLLEQLPESERLSMFLVIWTAKEAVLKALGRGIAFGLDRVGIGMESNSPVLLRLGDSSVDAWQLQPLAFGSGIYASLAWQGEPRRIRTGLLATRE